MPSPMPEKRTEPWASLEPCADELGTSALKVLVDGWPELFADSTLISEESQTILRDKLKVLNEYSGGSA
jgi:hypothetical protein